LKGTHVFDLNDDVNNLAEEIQELKSFLFIYFSVKLEPCFSQCLSTAIA